MHLSNIFWDDEKLRLTDVSSDGGSKKTDIYQLGVITKLLITGNEDVGDEEINMMEEHNPDFEATQFIKLCT